MRQLKNNKGITLIALVITIIVLIILAGVSISLVLGENGIVRKAQSAQKTTNTEKEREEISLALAEWEIVKTKETATLEEFMKEKFGEDKVVTGSNENEAIVTMESGNKYKVTAEGTVASTKGISINIGAFVEYNVAYTDMCNSNNKYTTTNGWRLLDYTKNADGTYSNVKLISTGIPAILYYDCDDTSNNSWYVKDSEQLANFKNVLGSEYEYYTGTNTYYALQASAGLYYNFKDIKFAYGASSRGNNLGYFTEITSNGTTYNSANTTETTGSKLFVPTGVNASVRLMTLPEMKTDPIGADGLFALQNIKNITGMSAYTYSNTGAYWLASPCPGCDFYKHVCAITEDFELGAIYKVGLGVRPVVCLTSNIQFTDNGNGVLKF